MIKKEKSPFLRQPVRHLDLEKTRSLFDLVQNFQYTSFQSRNIYKCFEVFRKMLADPACVIFLGISGAMIPGGMRKVIRDMIEMRLVDVIVSTGANIFHDLFESFGFRHYVGSEGGDETSEEHRIVGFMMP
jgi:deoxyhypusine synthase